MVKTWLTNWRIIAIAGHVEPLPIWEPNTESTAIVSEYHSNTLKSNLYHTIKQAYMSSSSNLYHLKSPLYISCVCLQRTEYLANRRELPLHCNLENSCIPSMYLQHQLILGPIECVVCYYDLEWSISNQQPIITLVWSISNQQPVWVIFFVGLLIYKNKIVQK